MAIMAIIAICSFAYYGLISGFSYNVITGTPPYGVVKVNDTYRIRNFYPGYNVQFVNEGQLFSSVCLMFPLAAAMLMWSRSVVNENGRRFLVIVGAVLTLLPMFPINYFLIQKNLA